MCVPTRLFNCKFFLTKNWLLTWHFPIIYQINFYSIITFDRIQEVVIRGGLTSSILFLESFSWFNIFFPGFSGSLVGLAHHGKASLGAKEEKSGTVGLDNQETFSHGEEKDEVGSFLNFM